MSQIDSKVANYRAMKLGYLPVVAISVRQTAPAAAEPHQSLTVELLHDELHKHVLLEFSGLRQLRLADLHPGIRCCLEIASVASDQMEGIRYRVANTEQDLTLNFYCTDFEVVDKSLAGVKG